MSDSSHTCSYNSSSSDTWKAAASLTAEVPKALAANCMLLKLSSHSKMFQALEKSGVGWRPTWCPRAATRGQV